LDAAWGQNTQLSEALRQAQTQAETLQAQLTEAQAQLAGAQKQWATLPAATRPRLLFVSADPERDTPQLVAQYAHAFHPDTLAATAPLPQLQAFARSLSLVFMKVPGASGAADDYSIDHSAALVLLDPQVRVAGVVQPPLDVKGIAADLATLTKTVK